MVSVFPTGVTIYKPGKSWNGFTVFAGHGLNGGCYLVDMNGNVIRHWEEVETLGKILPGGHLLGNIDYHEEGMERGRRLVQMNWEGDVIWEFNRTEKVNYEGEEVWSARVHHDFQREGTPGGYYSPKINPMVEEGKTLILASKIIKDSDIAPGKLLDDCILEVDWNGDLVWEWRSCEHFEEMGFDEEAKNAIYRVASLDNAYDGLHNTFRSRDPFDWLHSNCVSYLGPNKWYDAGDERFHPDNIIWGGRHSNTIGIIDRKSGEFTWRIGPDYTKPELQDIGQIIGQHHAHMIPQGLPGEGNILVFDNGGYGGYGVPNPGSPTGMDNAVRPYSRVLEIDPVSLEPEWEYSSKEIGYSYHRHYRFYSPYMSSAQRLPNGNTLICEADKGRLIEVTRDLEIVWEYVVPPELSSWHHLGIVYRAYRIPYDWIPQIKEYSEQRVSPPDLSNFKIEPKSN